MKNKKGFTLVELLAVIVILGILLLIAVPAVQNIIENSRNKAFESNAKLALQNVQQLVSLEKVSGQSIPRCYIPLSSIESQLERGSFGDNAHGFITVTDNGSKINIWYSNGKFRIISGTIDDIVAFKSTVSNSDEPQGSWQPDPLKCPFFDG